MIARSARLLLVLCAAILPAPLPVHAAETLREVLARHEIAPTSHPSPERQITSYGVLDEPTVFCIAFYWDNQTQSLDNQLEVLLVDRATGQARSTTLHYDKLIPDKPDFFAGSITRIVASPNFLFLQGHRNPSAGDVLVVSKAMDFQTSLNGWPLATFENDTLVYHKSQIHFAPIHAAEIALYDPHTRKEEQIYPREPYQEIRRNHIDALKRTFDSRPFEWFAQRNRPNDPEWFDNYLAGEVVVNSTAKSLAFFIRLDNRELMTDSQALKLEAFRELRSAAAKIPSEELPTDAAYSYLYSDLMRMRNLERSGQIVEAFPDELDLQAALRAAVDKLPYTGESRREFFLKASPEWADTELWKKLLEHIQVPAEYTEVAYVFRRIGGENLEYREILKTELEARFGMTDLKALIQPETLARIFQ